MGVASFHWCMTSWSLKLSKKVGAYADHQRHVITKFQQYVMVLMRLRFNLNEVDLSYRFGIGQATVSRLFDKWVSVMFTVLVHL